PSLLIHSCGDHDRHRFDTVAHPNLLVQHIQPDVAAAAQLALAKLPHLLIQRRAQLAYLRGRNSRDPKLLKHRLYLARADTLNHRFLDHADQGLLAAPAVLDEARDVAALAQLRNLQHDRSQPRVPPPVTISIAVS